MCVLGLGNSTIVIYCHDSRSTILMMIVLCTIVVVVDMIFEQILVHAWFLKIVSVWMCVCVCVCVHACVCVCVCPAPKAINN